MKNTALLIIDIQNDYFPGGKMELDKANGAANKTADLLTHFRKKEYSGKTFQNRLYL